MAQYYTVTAKDILAPVADAISQFVVINANVERSSAPMPDLRELAAAVAEQAVNLVDVSREMASDGDDILKRDFPPAGEIVLNASNVCKDAADELFQDPYSGAGRKKIIQGANGILTGTSRMLLVYDESLVRQIVEKGESTRDNIDKVKATDAPEILVQLVKKICDLLVQLTKMCREREGELLSSQQRIELRESLEKLSRQTPIMIGAVKSAAVHPKSKPLAASKQRGCEDLAETIANIERIVKTREWNDTAVQVENSKKGLAESINDNLVSVLSDTQQGLRPKDAIGGIEKSVENLFDYLNTLADDADELPLEASKTATSLKSSAIDSLAQLKNKMNDTQEMNSPKTQKSIQESLANVENMVTAAEELRDTIVMGEARILLDDLKDAKNGVLGKLTLAIKNGDLTDIDAIMNEFGTTADQLKRFLDTVQKQAHDPETARALKSAAKELAALSSQFLQLATAVKETGKASPTMAANADVLAEGCEQLATKLDGLIFTDESLVDRLAEVNAHAYAVRKYTSTLEKNPEKIAQQLKFTFDRLALLADKEAASVGDDVQRQKLLDMSKTFEKQSGNISDAIETGSAKSITLRLSPSKAIFESDVDKFQTLMRDTRAGTEKGQLKKANSVAKLLAAQVALENANGTDGPVVTYIDDEEVEIIDAEEPAPLDPREAEENPIKAAAHELKMTAAQWSKTNRLVELSGLISEQINRVSSVYREENSEDKKNLVELVKQVYQEVKDLHEEAQRIADACSDKSLKLNLQRAMESLPTLSTQLKILGAVKATASKDRDSERQLIICTRNLAIAVKNTLNCAESCALRTKRMMGSTTSATKAFVKFRRILYTKGSRSPGAQQRKLADLIQMPAGASPQVPQGGSTSLVGSYKRTPNINIPSDQKKSNESLAGKMSKPNSVSDLRKVGSATDVKKSTVDLKKSGGASELQRSFNELKNNTATGNSPETDRKPNSVSNIIAQLKNASMQKP